MRSPAPPLAFILCLLLLAPARAAPAEGAPAAPAAPLFDHHMHILSPKAAEVLKIACKRAGPEKCPPEISALPSTAKDALGALDAAGMKGGALLSTAYFFAAGDVKDLGLDIPRLTRAENAYVVGEALKSCGRLLAFISVNPLDPNALREIGHWAGRRGVTGLKLHLENSDLDYRDPRQVRRLAEVFGAAGRARLPIIVHMESRAPDYGARDVAVFLQKVLPAARGVPVQIAHAAGGGGVNARTLSALGAFADAIAADPAATANLDFDLAMVPDLVANTAQKDAPKADVERLRGLMARIGLRRFVLASDYTKPLNLARYYGIERTALALPDADWRTLADNLAPYVAAAPSACPAS